jgi:hypothetical protein
MKKYINKVTTIVNLKIIKTILFLLYFGLLNSTFSQTLFNFPEGIQFGISVEKAQKELLTISNSTEIVKNSDISFPLSKNEETHLIANSTILRTGTLDRVVFTFSDDKLVYIEAMGDMQKIFLSNIKVSPQIYMGYSVYIQELFFVFINKNKAWFLTPEATHLGLFTWNNPLLDKSNELKKYTTSVSLPEFIHMGKSMEELLPKFNEKGKLTQLDTLDGSDPNAQFQINCYGIEYAGFPRKFEARFGNNKLNKVWILTGKEEEGRLREMLIELYGKPIFINEDWEFFDGWKVGLRKDIPEVLYINEELGNYYKKTLKEE